MASVKIHIRLTCTVREDKETQCYVSHCPMLNVFSAGNTELEALEAIRSALTMYALALYRSNRLDEKLLTTGFFPVGDVRSIPDGSDFVAIEVGKEGIQQVEVDIPLILAMKEKSRELAHA